MRQPGAADDCDDADLQQAGFGHERWVMRQLLAAQMEITRRATPVRDRAAMIAELLRQHAEAMRAITYRQDGERAATRASRAAQRDRLRAQAIRPG